MREEQEEVKEEKLTCCIVHIANVNIVSETKLHPFPDE